MTEFDSGLGTLVGHTDLVSGIVISGSHLDPTANPKPVSNSSRTTQSQFKARQKLGARVQQQAAGGRVAMGAGSATVSGRGGMSRRVFNYNYTAEGDGEGAESSENKSES